MKKKMWIVKREVFATTIELAARAPGKIYEISLAEEKYQPEPKPKKAGFKK